MATPPGGGYMIEQSGTFLSKAQESVTGARAEFEGGRFNNSANRSYYAVFQAGIHALIVEGVRPPGGGTEWSHAFVDSQFSGLLVNRRHRYETGLRDVIRDNRKLREDADYTTGSVSVVRASRSLQRAERFVRAIVQRQEERA
jgi:uncharacterized protein (UPF0332 family)